MALPSKSDYGVNQELDIKTLVLLAEDQASVGKLKDFDDVCERLEKKYRSETL